MSGFFQVDDDYQSNHKVLALIEGETWGRAGAAVGLWTLAGSLCRKAGTDGVVTVGKAARLTGDRPGATRSAALLVKYELWHASGHTCEACPQPPDGAWIFHQWFQFRYGTGAAERVQAEKRRELRPGAIVESVWARDTDSNGVARCRYCATVVDRPSKGKGGDRRSKNIAWLDHVDPFKAIGASNIVVSCQSCNQTKAQRTPEQADMILLPPPINDGINPGSIGRPTEEVLPRGTRVGGVGVGAGIGVGSGLGRGGPAPVVPMVDPPWAPRTTR